MIDEVKIPPFGESINEVAIGSWLKPEGTWVAKGDPIVEIETDKINAQLNAPIAGILKVTKKKGELARIGEVIGRLEPVEKPAEKKPVGESKPPTVEERRVSPAARRVLAQEGIQAAEVTPTGRGGVVLKEDVLRHRESAQATPVASSPAAVSPAASDAHSGASATSSIAPASPEPIPSIPLPSPSQSGAEEDWRGEEVVPMSLLRRRVAERLMAAQHNAALLTTFNEIDMSSVVALRKEWQETFQAKHGIKLGLMSFFVKAAVEALKSFPALNGEIRGTDIVYKNYYDIGMAVGGGKGLVVPVIRHVDRLSFAEVEKIIADFSQRARDSKLKLEDLEGGTFTISNGGIYGSLLSTPIVNPPQSAILGMHAIVDRPVALNGQVVIRPMMYVALTYDHRIVDGREAVLFLRRIKDCVEQPERMLLEI